MLPGKKSYIVAVLIAAAAAAEYLGYIDATAREQIVTLLIGGGIAALRAGISKSNSFTKNSL